MPCLTPFSLTMSTIIAGCTDRQLLFHFIKRNVLRYDLVPVLGPIVLFDKLMIKILLLAGKVIPDFYFFRMLCAGAAFAACGKSKKKSERF